MKNESRETEEKENEEANKIGVFAVLVDGWSPTKPEKCLELIPESETN